MDIDVRFYCVWIMFDVVYAMAVVFGNDTPSPISILSMSVYSIPFMLAIWIAAGLLNRQAPVNAKY